MLWDKYDVAKEILEQFWVKYDPEKFTFAREKWTKPKVDGWELLELWFIVEETQKIFKLPMKWDNSKELKLLD